MSTDISIETLSKDGPANGTSASTFATVSELMSGS